MLILDNEVLANASPLEREIDLDTVRRTGIYVTDEAVNSPASGSFVLSVVNLLVSGIRYTFQQAVRVDDGEIWVRFVEQEWQQLSGVNPGNIIESINNLLGGDSWQNGVTNLSLEVNASTINLLSSSGTGVTLLPATITESGIMTAADRIKLEGIEAGAQANVPTDLAASPTLVDVEIESSTGDSATILGATNLRAGVLTAEDKVKLDGIEDLAEVNPTNEELVEGINAALGSTAWQGLDPGDEITNATVRVVSDSPINLSTLTPGTVIDGIALLANNAVLLVDQTDPAENGIYIVGTPSVRPESFDSFVELAGVIVTVQTGSEYSGSVWLCTSEDGGTIDVDPLVFIRTSIAPTNLSVAREANQTLIHSSTGSTGVIGAATQTQSGVLSAADKIKLDSLESGAQRTDISITHGAGNVTVHSSDGDSGIINPVSTLTAGIMTPALLTKLNSIEFGATGDMTPEEIVAAINAALGGTDWQSSGSGGGGVGTGAHGFLSIAPSDQGSAMRSYATVYFTTPVWSNGGTLGSYYWYPGITGQIVIGAHVRLRNASPTGGSGAVALYKNGTIIAEEIIGGNVANPGATITVVDSCTPSDYYWIGARSRYSTSSGGSQGAAGVVVAGSRFFGYALSSGAGGANITVTRDASQATIGSSSGTPGVLGAASTTQAGVMTAADKARLDSVDPSAEPNVPTDLSATRSSASVTIASSTGTDAEVPAATTSLSGVMSAADKTKLDSLDPNAEANVDTDLSAEPSATTVVVSSSTGADATITGATTTFAGVLTASDKAKLDGIESGAEVNPSGAEIVSAIDAELGSDDWQSGGGGSIIEGVAKASSPFSARNYSNQVMSNGNVALINLTADYDPENTFSNNEWTPGVEGVAHITVSGVLTNTGYVEILKNGSPHTRLGGNVTGEKPVSSTIVIPCDEDDVFSARVTALSNLHVRGTENSHFTLTGYVLAYGESSGDTNISVTHEVDSVGITSSTGTGDIIAAATDTLAGVMLPEQVSKLAGIEAGAEENPTGTEIVSAIDAELGNTDWQTGGSTDLSFTRDATTVTVESSSGDSAILPAATDTAAGVLSAVDKGKLDGIDAAHILYDDLEDQEITGGFYATPKDLGFVSSGTLLLEPNAGPLQKVSILGEVAVSPGTLSGQCSVLVTIGDSAADIDLSSWTKVIGDDLTNSIGDKFRFGVEIVEDVSILFVLKVT